MSSRAITLSALLVSALLGTQGCGSDGATPNTPASTPDVLSSEPEPEPDTSEGEARTEQDSASAPDDDANASHEDASAGPEEVSDAPCIPSCEDKTCGDDGCGGSCGSCAEDDDPCTDATCEEGACTLVFTDAACDDDDACTEGDTCAEGTCSGQVIDCEDGNTCIDNWCFQGNCMSEISEDPACELSITVETPARGAILESQDIVVVSGSVSSPAGLIDHVTVNGENVGVTADGGFTTTMVPETGLNIILVEGTNTVDQEERAAQSFLHGESFLPVGNLEAPTMLSDAMGLWLSPDAFDDNDLSDVDDLSTLAFLVLDGMDLNTLLPNPIFEQGERPSFLGCDYDVSITDITLTVDEVEFAPVDGGVHIYFELEDLYAYIAAESDDGLIGDNCADAKGPVSASLISTDVTLMVSIVNGAPVVTIDSNELLVSLYDFDWTIEEGLASLVDFLMPLVIGSIEDAIIDAISAQVQESILPLVNGILADFTSFERIFSLPAFQDGGNNAVMNLKVGLDDAVFTDAGVQLSLKVGSSAEDELEISVPGTLANAHCEDVPQPPLDKLPKIATAEAYLDVDLSNQLLHGLWASGFTHMTITDDLLGDTTEEYDLYNPKITIEPLVPPVVHSCTELGDAELQLGDLYVVAEFDTNNGPLILELYASAIVGADLDIISVPDGPDALGVKSVTPGTIVLDLQSVVGSLAFSDEVIELLLAFLVSEVIAGDLLTSLIGAFPLPEVGIGSYIPGLSDDALLTFDPKSFEGIGAHLTLGGDLAAQ